MTDETPHLPVLSLRLVYDDLPDLIEVEAKVSSNHWSGVARAYTGPFSLTQEARSFLAWSRRPYGECVIEAGANDGRGWVYLRWYALDHAGHLAGHVQFATPGLGDRQEVERRLALVLQVEAYSVELFSLQLIAMVETLTGEAVLGSSMPDLA